MIDYASIKQRLASFDAKHGASIRDGEWLVFPDGAAREVSMYGALQEPPREPWDLTRRVLHYRKLILDRAVDAFEGRRSFYTRIANANLNQKYCGNAPADPAVAAAELKELQKVVRTAKRAYDAQRDATEAAKPVRLREMEREQLANRKANQDLLNEIGTIEV